MSAEFTRLDGGAGYLVTDGKTQYVALAVYLNEEDGLAVQAGLDGLSTKLLHKGVYTLYFKGGQKKKSTLYLNALRTLEGYISVLNEGIVRLDKGATQESCKRILTLLRRQFAYAQREYASYPSFASSCGAWATTLTELEGGTIYVKDLRYLLCEQVEGYLALCEEFSRV